MASRLYWLPNVDIAVMEDNTVVCVELPGLTADDLELSILENVLTIEGERKPPEGVRGDQYRRKECPVGRFRRSVIIPDDADSEDLGADYENGVLKFTLRRSRPMA